MKKDNNQNRIAAYLRVLIDAKTSDSKKSIQKQKEMIEAYCREHFPDSTVDYYEDRDNSRNILERQVNYQKMKSMLQDGKYDTVIVSDMSRPFPYKERGLEEFENMVKQGIRWIAIEDQLDSARQDDQLKLKLYFSTPNSTPLGMEERLDRIAAYVRISVDTEINKENTSIEHQKAIIKEYCENNFPGSTVDYYEDRDKSGYTFEQREGYQKMRRLLLEGQYDILIVKDLSRFSRRTGQGLAEFEYLIEKGIRMIAIGDDVDLPTRDDSMKAKLYFFVNEMPVRAASDKVKAVIKNRQQKGAWVCSVPYGYVMTDTKKMQFEVDEVAAEVVREIFRLYIDGWGYKKIANYLTDNHIPTPRAHERARREAAGDDYCASVKSVWSIITVSEILSNDFYIGTLRQGKYHRPKINGQDVAVDEINHLVFENHHPAIVDPSVFATAADLRKQRSTTSYRGIKKYENNYSGFLFCGDCGSPMFAMSRKDLAPAYTCGTYHVRGRKGCTSHHIRVDVLDVLMKNYLHVIRDNAKDMIAVLEKELATELKQKPLSEDSLVKIEQEIEMQRQKLKGLVDQKVRDVMRAGEAAEVVAQTYDALIRECNDCILGLQNQYRMVSDSRDTMARTNDTTRVALSLFANLLSKKHLDKRDLHLIVDHIVVYEERIEVKLRSDIDELLRVASTKCDPGVAANFNRDREDNKKATDSVKSVVVQSAQKHADKVFSVHVISSGSPSRILMVLLISLGITTRPRSSILLTIPVAFIYKNLLVFK